MKKIPILLFLFFISCNENKKESTKINSNFFSDSLMEKNHNDIMILDTVTKKSDLITKRKVSNIIKEINYLTNTVEILKTEKSLLTRELQISKQNVRIDTVFIETKKNFWGKEKRSITVKSDSSQTEFLDSSSVDQIIDTTNHQ
jgi:hypothetical protein